MTNFIVSFYDRNNTEQSLPAGVSVIVERYSSMAVGGCDAATVEFQGNQHALWSLLGFLGYRIFIKNRYHQTVWWGFVEEILVGHGGLRDGLSLQQTYNRIAVAYTEKIGDTDTRSTTTWSENAESITAYGYREYRASLADSNQLQAEALRASLLDTLGKAIKVQSEGSGNLAVTMYCKGWWYTLDYRYYTQLNGLCEYNVNGGNEQLMGSAAATTKVGQRFQLLANQSWTVAKISARVRKVGAPGDSLKIELCSDSGGSPSTVLQSAAVLASTLATAFDWEPITFANTITVASGSSYWVVLSRTGANDATNHYAIDMDETLGYADGDLKIYDGASWAARSPAADMPFRVESLQMTTAQISPMITAAGQFIDGGVDIQNSSNIYSLQYRDGETKALPELALLLRTGTNSARRLLATVTTARVLKVYEQSARPEMTAVLLAQGNNGLLYDGSGNRLVSGVLPTGQWLNRQGIPPTVAENLQLSPFFCERAEYHCQSNTYRIEPLGTPSVWDLIPV